MHQERRIVPYSADLMYLVVAEVEHYPKFLPWVLGLRVKSRSGNIVVAEMLVGYRSFRERYTSKVTLDPENYRIDVVQIDGPFRKLENHWHFTPKGESCEIDFGIDFEFKNRLMGAVAGAAFEKVLLKMSTAFEDRAAALSRSPA